MLNKKQMKELIKELEEEKLEWSNKATAYLRCLDSVHLEIKHLNKRIEELRDEVVMYKQKYANEVEKRISLAEKLSKYV